MQFHNSFLIEPPLSGCFNTKDIEKHLLEHQITDLLQVK